MKARKQNILVAVDIVVFTIISGDLNVLLIKRKNNPYKNQYAIPGGFMEDNESLEEAASRELQQETNVKNIFIKKLTAYGDVKRDPRGRVVTIVFIALIDSEKFKLRADTDALKAVWRPITDIENLAFDHMTILRDSLTDLRHEIQTTNIASQILPEKFTLSELQNLYSIILEKDLDKRNFRKRIQALDILQATRETKMGGAHRPATLYRFKDLEYKTLKEKIHIFT